MELRGQRHSQEHVLMHKSVKYCSSKCPSWPRPSRVSLRFSKILPERKEPGTEISTEVYDAKSLQPNIHLSWDTEMYIHMSATLLYNLAHGTCGVAFLHVRQARHFFGENFLNFGFAWTGKIMKSRHILHACTCIRQLKKWRLGLGLGIMA